MKLPKFAMTYVVYWPDAQVMKVGRAYRSARLGSFLASGAEIVVLVRDTPVEWERSALAAFRDRFPRAFSVAAESLSLLSRGRGFTECFRVAPDEVGAAVTVFKKAVADHAIHSRSKVQARGVESRRAVSVVESGSSSVPVVAAVVCGSAGAGGDVVYDVAGDVLRVRQGRDGGDDRVVGGGVGERGLAAVVCRGGSSYLFSDQSCGVGGVRVDGWSRQVASSGAGSGSCGRPVRGVGRLRGDSGWIPGGLRVDCGRGEGGGRAVGGVQGVPCVDVRSAASASSGLSSSSEQHWADQLWGVWRCTEDSYQVREWRDLSRGGCGGVERGASRLVKRSLFRIQAAVL